MLLKVGIPSAGHPTPTGFGDPLTISVCTFSGWHSGDEYARRPTRSIPFPPTTVPPCTQFPPLPALYGSVKPVHDVAGVPAVACTWELGYPAEGNTRYRNRKDHMCFR